MLRHQLHHVLVAGYDVYLVPLLRGFARQRTNHVIGLKTNRFENRNTQCIERPADVRNLPSQILGHGFAMRLVPLVAHVFKALRLRVPLAQRAHGTRTLVAKHLAAWVEDRSKILRLKILAQLLDHVYEHVGGRGGQPRARRHGPRALHGMIRAEDERHGVEQKDGRLGWVGHD